MQAAFAAGIADTSGRRGRRDDPRPVAARRQEETATVRSTSS